MQRECDEEEPQQSRRRGDDADVEVMPRDERLGD
jgi:hypothetical protein